MGETLSHPRFLMDLYIFVKMKRLLITAVLILTATLGFAQVQLEPVVDERIELNSTVFRLAGIPEYNMGLISSYNEAIDSCFMDFKDSKLMEYVMKMREENGLGYSAVAASSLYLKIENGKVRIDDRMDLSTLPGLGHQWKDEKAFRKYVSLLNDFYVKSDFHTFFENSRPIYEKVTGGMKDMLKFLNTEWFAGFFGQEFPSVHLYVGVVNGRSNYYLGPNSYYYRNADPGFSIILGALPHFTLDNLYPLLHETCHHFSNPLFEEYWPQMQDAGEKMFPYVADSIMQYGYGSAYEAMLEWQNNLFSAMYYRENYKFIESLMFPEERIEELKRLGVEYSSTADNLVVPMSRQNMDRGFIWFKRSVDFMENFFRNRDIYPHVADFMPQLVKFLDHTARDYGRVMFEFENRHPYVVNVFPAAGSNIWNDDLEEIRVTFSEPMALGIFGVSGMTEEDQADGGADISALPLMKNSVMDGYHNTSAGKYWSADNRTFVIKIDRERLERDRNYGIKLSGAWFMDEDRNKMLEDFTITYTTETAQLNSEIKDR